MGAWIYGYSIFMPENKFMDYWNRNLFSSGRCPADELNKVYCLKSEGVLNLSIFKHYFSFCLVLKHCFAMLSGILMPTIDFPVALFHISSPFIISASAIGASLFLKNIEKNPNHAEQKTGIKKQINILDLF